MTIKNVGKNISAEPGDIVLDISKNTLTKLNNQSNFSNNLVLTIQQQDFLDETNTPHNKVIEIPLSEVVRLGYLQYNYYSKTQADTRYPITVEKQESEESGILATYIIKQNGNQVGSKIDIPKDFLVKSASLKTVTTANKPLSGYKKGDKYLDFVINSYENSEADSHIYINVKELIDIYTADESTLTLDANNQFKVKDGGITEDKLATALQTIINNKVDKIPGKGLSTEDYTTSEKAKVATIDNKADKSYVDVEDQKLSNRIDAKAEITYVDTANQQLSNAIDTKVDKVSGMGLSENNFTTALLNKLVALDPEAVKVIIDTQLNTSSTNPVENRVVANALSDKADTSYVDQQLLNLSNGIEIDIRSKADEHHKHGEITWDGKLDKASQIVVTNNNKEITTSATIDKSQIDNFAHSHNTTEITESVALNNIGSTQNSSQASINKKIDTALGIKVNKSYVDNADQTLSTQINAKVDKVDGMGLSEKSFTQIEKTKLGTIAEGATKTIVDTELDENSTNPLENKAIFTVISQVLSYLDNKVDKVDGMGLSEKSYTQADKDKVATIDTKPDFAYVDNADLRLELSLNDKVDKISGMGLSEQSYTQTEKDKVATIDNKADKTYVDNADQALSAQIDTKVDKVSGMGLSEQSYTQAEKNKVATIDNKADKAYVDSADQALSTQINTKVDKVSGMGLSETSYTQTEKDKVATIDNKADKTYVDSADQALSANIKTLSDRYMLKNDISVRLIRTKSDGTLYSNDTFESFEGSQLIVNTGDRLNIQVTSQSGQNPVNGLQVTLIMGSTVKFATTQSNGRLSNADSIGLNNGQNGVAQVIVKGDLTSHNKTHDIVYVNYNS